jgi:hypothetical protein
MAATYDDVNLILRLYEMRREERMRRARDWFSRNYKGVTSMKEHAALCAPGSDEEAYVRMLVSYWDMVASFITSGVLNRELFFESGRELLLVWLRIEKMAPELRTAMNNPHSFGNIEKVAREYMEWIEKRSPGHLEAWRGFVGV